MPNKLNYFELFGFHFDYQLDQEQLTKSFLELLNKNHPDRFVNSSNDIKTAALKNAVTINQAYKTLKSPYLRLEYMLELLGFNLDEDLSIDDEFLEESFAIRQRIKETTSLQGLKKMLHELNFKEKEDYNALPKIFSEKLYSKTIDVYIRLKFLRKIIEEVEQKIESLEFENEVI